MDDPRAYSANLRLAPLAKMATRPAAQSVAKLTDTAVLLEVLALV
jgi:hypothetical protein